jgi:hypothetical protein
MKKNLKLIEKVFYPVLFCLLGIAIYYSRTNMVYFESVIVADDGIFQKIIFFTIFFASVMCFYRASILKPFRGSLFAVSQIFLGVIFFIFSMDEISWMQRIFHFASPLFFQSHNIRGQMNFHNLTINGFYVNDLVFTLAIRILATLYFLILPFLYPRYVEVRNFVNRFAIPLPRYTQTAVYVLLAFSVHLIHSKFYYVVFELGFYWLLVLMMYNPLNDDVFSRKTLNR